MCEGIRMALAQGLIGRGTVEFRRRIGCWLNERWRTECALNPALSRITGIRWQDLHNRIESLNVGGDSVSRVCNWQWTSELTVCRVFPETAARLCRHCFREWPLGQRTVPLSGLTAEDPLISVILPVGGAPRHAALMVALKSFLCQTVGHFEIIVAEQSAAPMPHDQLPRGVRYLHVPDEEVTREFNKSRLLNKAVQMARAPWALLHDADIAVPGDYLDAILQRAVKGWEAVRPIRFLFYLDEPQSLAFSGSGILPTHVERVTQNFPGGSTAIKRETYWQIGGLDERFEGWGGEDTEFLDRLRTRRVFPGHFAPALHLWHPPAPKKQSGDRNQKLLAQQMGIPAEERSRQLRGDGGVG
jgi:hypothetical protein